MSLNLLFYRALKRGRTRYNLFKLIFLGPLAKRIKTKHMQEIALSGSVTLTPSVSNPSTIQEDNSAIAGPSSASGHQSTSQQEQPGIHQGSSSHHQESQELNVINNQQGSSNQIAGSSSQGKKSTKPPSATTPEPERPQPAAEEMIRHPPLCNDNQQRIAQQQGKLFVISSEVSLKQGYTFRLK